MNQAYGNTRLARGLVRFAGVFNLAALFMLCPTARARAGAVVLMVLLAVFVPGGIGAYAAGVKAIGLSG